MSKKKVTYGQMARLMADMQRKLTEERKRMANVMSEALLSDIAAAKLGDYSDHDLRRIMTMLADYIDECVARLEAEKAVKKGTIAADLTPTAQQPFDERGTVTA